MTMYSSVCLALAVGLMLCGNAWSNVEYDAYCTNLGKEEMACFTDKDLGYCTKNGGDSWLGISITQCGDYFDCNAVLGGCIFNNPDLDLPSSTCTLGDLKNHADCQKYYYCSQNVWVVGSCPTGHYDENYKRCVLGECVN